MHKSIFSRDRTIYWPEEYDDIVEFLKGSNGESKSGVFTYNTGIVVLAATIGLKDKYRKKIEGRRKEIALSTFEEHGLSHYIYLIALASEEKLNLDLMRNEAGEEAAIRIFESYAAGGLSILNQRQNTGGLKSPYLFMYDLVTDYGIAANQSKGSDPTSSSSEIKDIDLDLQF
jgi:dnd system-associated protein 4